MTHKVFPTPVSGIPSDLKGRVIGYTRVSTKAQEPDLDTQAERIREACRQRGMAPVAIYEDVGTGMKPESLERLNGLQDAVEHARREHLPLVVTDRLRISRMPGEAEKISVERGVEFIIIEEGFAPLETATPPKETKGWRFGERVANKTKEALKRPGSGRKLGNPNLPAARRAASISRIVRADDRVREIANFLRTRGTDEKVTAREVLDHVNRIGLPTERGASWTLAGIRRPLRAARERLLLEDEVAAELERDGFT